MSEPSSPKFNVTENFNPYWNRLAIDDPNAFFGREEEREHLIQLISRGQPVSIVGQRRIGNFFAALSGLSRPKRMDGKNAHYDPGRLLF
jgi:hypothetical protein